VPSTGINFTPELQPLRASETQKIEEQNINERTEAMDQTSSLRSKKNQTS